MSNDNAPDTVRLNLSAEEYSLLLALVTLGGEAYDGKPHSIECVELLDRVRPRDMRGLWRKLEAVNAALEAKDGC